MKYYYLGKTFTSIEEITKYILDIIKTNNRTEGKKIYCIGHFITNLISEEEFQKQKNEFENPLFKSEYLGDIDKREIKRKKK